MIWLLLAQLIVDAPCTNTPTCFAVAFRQVKKDTVVVLNYPAKPVKQACSVLYQRGDGEEMSRHCWTPKAGEFTEFDIWEDLNYKGSQVYFNVEIWCEDGTYGLAEPIPDAVYESNQRRALP